MTDSFTYTDRVKHPLWKKLFPLWWFGNDLEPWPPAWYSPGKWYRTPAWYLRNPLQNFGRYVIGVMDRDYTVYGRAPMPTTMRADNGEDGWQWSVIHLGILRLPFISYSGWCLFYIGWQPTGFFGVKFNITHSPVQVV